MLFAVYLFLVCDCVLLTLGIMVQSSWGILQAEVEVIDDSTIGSRWKTHINSDVHGVPYQMQANTKPLNGKCVKHTGRTVISPDSDLKITEVSISLIFLKMFVLDCFV